MNIIYNNYISSWCYLELENRLIFSQFSITYAIPINKKIVIISRQKKISLYDLLKLTKINGNIILAATPKLLQLTTVSKLAELSYSIQHF